MTAMFNQCTGCLRISIEFLLFLQFYISEPGWCEEGVGEGWLPGKERTCGGGGPG